MKSKTIIIIMILIITSCLWAENGWSLPKQLSNIQCNMSPHMAIGSDGVIHAVWEAVEELGDGYGYIVYSKSEDDGITWTEPLKISSNIKCRAIENSIALDSNNNPHVAYTLSRTGSECVSIHYTTFDGLSWSEPIEVDHYIWKSINIVIDSDNRVYLFWNLAGIFYFTYLNDKEWVSPERMEYDGIKYGVKSVKVDSQNNLLAVGFSYIDYAYDERACLMTYNKKLEKWTQFENITDNNERSIGCHVFLTSENEKHVTIYYGNNSMTEETYYTYYDSYWHNKEYISDQNFMDKKIVVDKNNDIHIFEIHEDNDSDATQYYLTHSYRTESGWQIEKVCYWNGVKNRDFDACIYNDKLYVVFDRAIYSSVFKICFSKKEIELGIEDNSEVIEKGFELSNYPNPFNPVTTINYQLNKADNVNLVVFNATGKQVWESGERKQGTGKHTVKFDGSKFTSGIYFYSLEANGRKISMKKMMLIK